MSTEADCPKHLLGMAHPESEMSGMRPNDRRDVRQGLRKVAALKVSICLSVVLIGLTVVSSKAPAQSNVQNSAGQQQVDVPSALPTFRDLREPLPNTESSRPLSSRQKLKLVQANFEKSKSDAVELAALAKELREELNKPDVDVLSAEVTNRAERIEKLAKKIREETKGF